MFSIALDSTSQLRPLEVWHVQEFADHLDRARDYIRPWVGSSFVTGSMDGAATLLARYATSTASDGARLFGIWDDDQLVGGVNFRTFNAAAGVCEIGCWLEPAAQGRGLITRAAAVLVDWALRQRGLNRVEWWCRADNARSAAVAQRLGMRLEGVLRGAWLYDGEFHDKQVWALLRSEYLEEASDAVTV